MKGICGRLLEVDLTAGKTKEITISEDLFQKYLGGRGLGARLLYDLLPAKTDPLSPENVMLFMTGPLTGSHVTGSSKFVVVTKSPLTNGWCDSYSSGRISVELKKVGYDGMVIRGKSNHPCYLRLDGEQGGDPGCRMDLGKRQFRDRENDQREREGFVRRRFLHRARRRKVMQVCVHQQRSLPPGRKRRRGSGHGFEEPQGHCDQRRQRR